MAIIALGTFPEGILGGEVFEVSVGTTLPGMVFGRRALYDELIWDSDGGFAANWAGYSSLTGDGTSGYTFLLQRNGYSAAGFALFSSTAAGSGGGSGNVTGPGSSTDNAIVRWNGNTGVAIQNSLVGIDDTGNISLPSGATVDGVDISVAAAAPYLVTSNVAALANERVLTAGAGLASTDGGAGGAFTLSQRILQEVHNVATYTPVLADAFKLKGFGFACDITLPLNSAVAFPIGTKIWFYRGAAAYLNIAGDVGVSVILPGGRTASARGQRSTIGATKIGTDSWILDGDLADATPYVTVGAVADLTSERSLTAGAGLASTDGGAGGAFTIQRNIPQVALGAVSAYTLLATDNGKVLNSSAVVTVTIPDNASVSLPAGAELWVFQASGSASQITIVAGAGGVVLRVPVGYTAATRTGFSQVRLRQISANLWAVDGDLKPSIPYLTVGAVSGLESERAFTAGAGLAATDGGADGAYTLSANIGLNTVSATSYTFVLTDAFKQVAFTNAAGLTATIPPNSSVAFPIGTRIWVQQNMASAAPSVTIAAGAGVSMSVPTGRAAATRTSQSVICLQKIGTDAWVLSGDLMDTSPYVTVGSVSDMSAERALTQGAGVSITDGGAGGAVTVAATGDYTSITTWTATTLTLSATHRGGLILANGTAAQTLTLPTDGSDNLPVGYRVRVVSDNVTSAYDVTLSVSGLTYKGYSTTDPASSANVLVTFGQWADIVKIGSNSWIAMGGLAPTIP